MCPKPPGSLWRSTNRSPKDARHHKATFEGNKYFLVWRFARPLAHSSHWSQGCGVRPSGHWAEGMTARLEGCNVHTIGWTVLLSGVPADRRGGQPGTWRRRAEQPQTRKLARLAGDRVRRLLLHGRGVACGVCLVKVVLGWRHDAADNGLASDRRRDLHLAR